MFRTFGHQTICFCQCFTLWDFLLIKTQLPTSVAILSQDPHTHLHSHVVSKPTYPPPLSFCLKTHLPHLRSLHAPFPPSVAILSQDPPPHLRSHFVSSRLWRGLESLWKPSGEPLESQWRACGELVESLWRDSGEPCRASPLESLGRAGGEATERLWRTSRLQSPSPWPATAGPCRRSFYPLSFKIGTLPFSS